MTKKVRIENADGNNYVVVVEVQGQDEATNEWKHEKFVTLYNPADLHEEMLWGGKRLIITEKNR